MKRGSFVTIDYTGKLEDGSIFDTTKPTVAKNAGLDEQRVKGPITICIGQGQLVKGLDTALEGASPGKHTFQIPAEQGFGKKSGKLLKLYPLSQFKGQEIKPVPGLELNIDGRYGIVKSVSGGRVIVDFNHPLASHDLTYEIEIYGEVNDPKAQVESLMTMAGIPFTSVRIEGDHALISVDTVLPQPLSDLLHKQITTLTKITTVSFETRKQSAPQRE